MPIRRPSASGALASSANSRAHRSNDSHHGYPGSAHRQPVAAPTNTSGIAGPTATPQQKVVQVLVNRLKNKLPSNSGVSLDALESDKAIEQAIKALVELSHDSLDIIAWAITELLDRLAKTDSTGILSTEILQSQLFLLKVLSVAMSSRWKKHKEDNPNFSDPPTLNDNCAKYIISVMVLYLRQSASPDPSLLRRASSAIDSYFRDFEFLDCVTGPALGDDALDQHLSDQQLGPSRPSSPTSPPPSEGSQPSSLPIPQGSWIYERTHPSQIKSPSSMNALIGKYTGRIVYYLSASNWTVVLFRLRAKIHYLAQTSEERPDVVDMSLMTHSALDRVKLIQVLNELSSLLVNMKRDVQVALAAPLRSAIWNWIEICPTEFNEALRSRGRMEGAPERVFDLLYSAVQPGSEKMVWPTLTILNCISSERLSMDFQMTNFGAGSGGGGQKNYRKDNRFIEDIVRHANTSSKLAELALVCALDMSKAAAYLQDEDLPLKSIAYDIAHEVKSALWKNSLQKPFWDSGEEIDVDLYTHALVVVYLFLHEDESVPLFMACLEPERSCAVKICVVKACLILSTEQSRLPLHRSLKALEENVPSRLRSIFKATALQRSDTDQFGNAKRTAPRPKIRRIGPSENLTDREVLLLGLLSLWRSRSLFFGSNLDHKEYDEWFSASLKLWETSVDDSVKISTACSFRLLIEVLFRMSPNHPRYQASVSWLKQAMSEMLINMACRLINARESSKDERLWVKMCEKLIEHFCRKSHISIELQASPACNSAFILAQIAFLISLTSADIVVSQAAGHCLRLIAQAGRQPGAPANPSFSEDELSKRNPIYEQLGDPNVTIIGRVGYQKRIRKLIRFVAYPSPIHSAVWQECYWRWRGLYEFISEPHPNTLEESEKNFHTLSWEEKHVQWRNLTLFLAAFGGACIHDGQELRSLASLVPTQYLPDEIRVPRDSKDLVGTFVTDLTDLLIADSMQVREVAREALGSELSPRLYSRLVKHLDEVIQRISLEAAGTDLSETFTLFLDQFIAVLKLLLENTQIPPDEVLSMDVGTTSLALAGFVNRFNDPTSYRIKIKFCAFCDNVCSRTDALSFRKDTADRHSILDIVMEWIQDPAPLSDLESARAQVDLNRACLRTAVKLLDRLQLRPLDGSVGDDSGHVVSRLFHRYSSILLKGLDICQLDTSSDGVSEVPSVQQKMRTSQREAELRELVITGLSHLVSANTESGFKQCLPLAYDQDARKRAIFAHVFSRVLSQGTKFEQQDTSAAVARRSRLCELVTGSDMVLAMAICETCPAAEVDIMISVLLNLFDTRTSLLNLLKLMIDREISHTESESSLFRGNSTYTRFLSAFAKVHGYNYLRGLIVPLVKSMASLPPGLGYELDPSKAGDQDVDQNRENVQFVAASFLEIISSSVSALPSLFREICAHIAKSVNEVWPEAKFAALGAFIFLRFISPAIVAPELVDVELPKDEEGMIIRRGLMVIAKIIQNLANNIFFGKEPYMVALNTFLQDNIVNVTRYLSEVNKYSAVAIDEEEDEWLGNTPDDTDTIVLHRYFERHADKIGKELLSLSKINEVDQTAINGKRSWDGLCAALVDLGQAPEIPRLAPYSSSEHREYLDLISRYAYRNTDAVRDIFVETPAPKDQPAVFIFRISQIDVESLDVELLMFHIFKTLSLPVYEQRHFEFIVDCTGFCSSSELPVRYLKYCIELVPQDIRQRLLTTYILNANAQMQRYLRRLYNISAGTQLSGVLRACSCVAELQDHKIPAGCIAPLVYATSLEDEPCEEFNDITMRYQNQMRMPVVLLVARTHLRITSIKAQPISLKVSCRATEIIPLGEISDIYNVSTGHDQHEFIIRRTRQGITLYFASPERDTIVKTIRMAKGQLRDSQISVSDRFSRFSNVPATLLHVGMLSVDSEDEELRSAAYDLLGAVCSYVGYDKNPVLASKAGFIPGDPHAFAVQLSNRLAEFIPAMTLDFISEVIAGMGKALSQRINCLQYMSPWIKNLASFPNPTSPHYEHSGARLRDCIRALTDLTLNQAEMSTVIQKCVWSEVGKLDSTAVNVVLEELIRAAIDGGAGSQRSETIARIVSGISSINVRGRIYSKLRKTLGKTSGRTSRSLADNAHWNEIATLIRLALVAGNQSKQAHYHQLYVPEIAHIVTITAATGQTFVRKSVYGIVMNLLQAVYLSQPEEPFAPDVLALINDCTRPEVLQLFGLARTTSTSDYTNYDPSNDKTLLDLHEGLADLLIKIMQMISTSPGLHNVWRARWMSLVTSTAFQLSPALQTRAFVLLGALASSEVDDDLFYQILVACKTSLAQVNETDTISVVSMLRCICKAIPSLADSSRYIFQVFWLGVALLQCSHVAFHAEACNIIRITLENLEARGMLRKGSVPTTLLDHRAPLDDIASQIDNLLELSFEDNGFSFALSAVAFKGVRHSGLRSSTEALLRTLLRVTLRSITRKDRSSHISLPTDVLGYFLALIPFSTTWSSYKQLLEECGIGSKGPQNGNAEGLSEGAHLPRLSLDCLGINDGNTALLVATFVTVMLTSAQGNDAESEILYTFLADMANTFPEILSMIYDGLQDKIKDTFANSSNPTIIKAVSTIFRVALRDPRRVGMSKASVSTLQTTDESIHGPGQQHLRALEELAMQGLATNVQFSTISREATQSTGSRILQSIPELIIRIIE